MAETPKHITVSVSADELTKLTERYQQRIDKQKERIALYIQFLTERGLIGEFGDWEESRGE